MNELLLFCALGFESDNTSSLVDTSEQGIFNWDKPTMEAIGKWNLSGTKKDKQLVLVSYLFDLVYDLMNAPGNIVSVNGSFETCHGFVRE